MGMLLSQIRLELESHSITKHVHSSPTSVVSSSFTKYSSTQAALTSNLTGGLFKKKSLNIVPTSYNSALSKCSPTHSPAITNKTSDLPKRRSPQRICYDTSDSNHFLSNCFEADFKLEGHRWPTVLHYFVAKKV